MPRYPSRRIWERWFSEIASCDCGAAPPWHLQVLPWYVRIEVLQRLIERAAQDDVLPRFPLPRPAQLRAGVYQSSSPIRSMTSCSRHPRRCGTTCQTTSSTVFGILTVILPDINNGGARRGWRRGKLFALGPTALHKVSAASATDCPKRRHEDLLGFRLLHHSPAALTRGSRTRVEEHRSRTIPFRSHRHTEQRGRPSRRGSCAPTG